MKRAKYVPSFLTGHPVNLGIYRYERALYDRGGEASGRGSRPEIGLAYRLAHVRRGDTPIGELSPRQYYFHGKVRDAEDAFRS